MDNQLLLALIIIDRIINSSMRTLLKQSHINQTLPTQFHSFQEDTEKDSSLTHFYYDTFAFRDRLTNKHFQYKQARKNKHSKQNIILNDWTKNQTKANRELKASLNVYKYTKKFEINCIRSKYLRQTYNQKKLKQQQNKQQLKDQILSNSKQISRDCLYQINKEQMKRMLETNAHVSPDILQLNRSKKYQYSMTKNKKCLVKLKFINNNCYKQNDSFAIDQIQKRQTQKIMNHMKNQIKSNCQYLLNIPVQKKKKNMFKNQLKKYINEESTTSKFNHSQIDQCKFNSIDQSVSFNASEIKLVQDEVVRGHTQIINLVKKGFMNQVYLQIKDNQHSSLTKDQRGNNIFHIVAKQGNIDMANNLLKIVPSKICLTLLNDRNRLKRTPKDKALMLGYKDIARLFDQFISENRHIIL